MSLQVAHEGHPGICLMKRRLRDRYYWPGLDRDVEKLVDTCDGCKLVAVSFPAAPLKRIELPEFAWQKLSIDFLSPAPSGEKMLVVVDRYSRYFEVFFMSKTDAVHVIEVLEELCGRLDFPEEILADNGPPFASREFHGWAESRGIRIRHSLPYQPRINGAVEVTNKLLSKAITIAVNTGKDWKIELQKFIANHRQIKHSVTGVPPLELMINRNRKLRGTLHGLEQLVVEGGWTDDATDDMEIRDRDWEAKQKGKEYADRYHRLKEVDVMPGDFVLVKRPRKQAKWESRNFPYKFKVMEKRGPAVVIVDKEGRWKVRDVSQLVKVAAPQEEQSSATQWQAEKSGEEQIVVEVEGEGLGEEEQPAHSNIISSGEQEAVETKAEEATEERSTRTRCGRIVKPSGRWRDFEG